MNSYSIWEVDAALFDLDGTIVDLNFPDPKLMGAREEVKQLYAEHGVEKEFSPFLGTIKEATEALRQNGDDKLATELREQAYERIAEEDLKAARAGAVRIDARPLLRELRNSGIPVGIVTNNSRCGAQEILDNSGLPAPDVLVTRDDVEQPKPDPEMILTALERFNQKIDSYLIVGDSESDITAALRANRQVCRNSTNILVGEENNDSAADICIERLCHLQKNTCPE